MKLSAFFRKHGWCQGAYAKTAKGRPVGPHSKSATQWCITGAMRFLAGISSESYRQVDHALEGVAWRRGMGAGYVVWQDQRGRTKAEVIRFLKEAGL
jgi:hypothetical protein